MCTASGILQLKNKFCLWHRHGKFPLVWALPIYPPLSPTDPQYGLLVFVFPRKYSLCTLVLAWAALTESHNLVSSKQTKQNWFLTVPEAGSPRSRCQHAWRLVRASSRLQTADSLLYPHVVERGGASSLDSSYQGSNPIHEGSLHRHDPITLQRPPPPNSNPLGIRCQYMNVGRGI